MNYGLFLLLGNRAWETGKVGWSGLKLIFFVLLKCVEVDWSGLKLVFFYWSSWNMLKLLNLDIPTKRIGYVDGINKWFDWGDSGCGTGFQNILIFIPNHKYW